jgi:NADH-quinone oxidoreductase subunit F
MGKTAYTDTPRHLLCKRIPTPPYGDWNTRHYVGYDEYAATGGYVALRKALAMTPEAVINEVKKAVIRGRGGAGFPAGVKWTFLPPVPEGKLPGEPGAERYLAVNADESEPATFKDRLLMEFDPHQMLEGIAIACHACRLHRAYIFIRGEYHLQAEVLERALAEAYAHGIFGEKCLQLSGANTGGQKFRVDCFVHRGAGAYICGEETALLEAIEGKRGWPRIKPPFPAVEGLFGRPTIINNVETLCHVPFVVDEGAAAFMAQGVESSVGGPPSYGTKLMGMSGHVNRPGVYEFELGIPLRRFVEEHCGGMRGGKKYKAAIPGGVSMGILGTDQYDAELDFDIGRKYNVLGLGTACPTVFDEDTDMVAVARNITRFYKHESCGQCTPCREGSGWLYQILTRMTDGDARTKDLDIVLEVAQSMGTMPGTTICGLADGNNWAMKTLIGKFRAEFEAKLRPTFVTATVGAS